MAASYEAMRGLIFPHHSWPILSIHLTSICVSIFFSGSSISGSGAVDRDAIVVESLHSRRWAEMTVSSGFEYGRLGSGQVKSLLLSLESLS